MWKKKEIPVPKEEEIVVSSPVAAEEEPAEVTETLSEALAQTHPRRRRKTSRGTRRGQYRFAAWIGLVVLLLAFIGAVAVVALGIGLIQKATDHTDLMIDLRDHAMPLIEYQPAAFERIEAADETVLLRAAIFRITEAERIWQLQEKTSEYSHEVDDYGRLILSVDEINESFAALFGTHVTPRHQTLGESSGVAYTFEYDKANACYYVPFSVSSSLYTTLTEDIELRGDKARIRVAYALTNSLPVDKYGNTVTPDNSTIEYRQWYEFTETDAGWVISAVEDIEN